jgi:membrane-bound lytic murein transglycosylase F
MSSKTIIIGLSATAVVVALIGAVTISIRDTDYAPKWLHPVLKAPRETGEIVFLTLRGPTTTQNIPVAGKRADETQTGFEHDLATLFAQEIGARPKFVVASGYNVLTQSLSEGRAHIAAAGMMPTPELRQQFAFGPNYKSVQYQLIYRVGDAKPKTMRDVIGKRVAVVAETPAHDLLRELTGEYPGFGIEALPQNTNPDELLKQVDSASTDAIDFALVDTSAFALGKRLHPDLAAAFNVGRERKVAWAFSSVADYDLQQSALAFFDKIRGNGTLARLLDRYYGHINRIQSVDAEAVIEKIEKLLPRLRPHFHEAQRLTGIDWRLLAAVGYQESHWDQFATSPTGVRGLMMLTDDTADRMNVKNRLDARESIIGGSKYLLKLRETVPERIPEPDRTWLALAAYNQGYGHLEDARILTARLKMNADSWLDVRKAYPKLHEPAIYESLKHGYARGEEAVQFVENIRNYADILTKLEKPLEVDESFAALQEDAELANSLKRRLNVQARGQTKSSASAAPESQAVSNVAKSK